MKGTQALHTSNFSDFRVCQNAFIGVIDLLVSGSTYQGFLLVLFDIFIFFSSKLAPNSCLQLKLLTELNKKNDELSSTGVWNWVHVQPQSSNWVDLISRLSYCWHVYFFHQLPLFISWCLDLVSKSGCFFTWRWVHIIHHNLTNLIGWLAEYHRLASQFLISTLLS